MSWVTGRFSANFIDALQKIPRPLHTEPSLSRCDFSQCNNDGPKTWRSRINLRLNSCIMHSLMTPSRSASVILPTSDKTAAAIAALLPRILTSKPEGCPGAAADNESGGILHMRFGKDQMLSLSHPTWALRSQSKNEYLITPGSPRGDANGLLPTEEVVS